MEGFRQFLSSTAFLSLLILLIYIHVFFHLRLYRQAVQRYCTLLPPLPSSTYASRPWYASPPPDPPRRFNLRVDAPGAELDGAYISIIDESPQNPLHATSLVIQGGSGPGKLFEGYMAVVEDGAAVVMSGCGDRSVL